MPIVAIAAIDTIETIVAIDAIDAIETVAASARRTPPKNEGSAPVKDALPL